MLLICCGQCCTGVISIKLFIYKCNLHMWLLLSTSESIATLVNYTCKSFIVPIPAYLSLIIKYILTVLHHSCSWLRLILLVT